MSLLYFEQRSDRVTGLYLLDADPDWSLSLHRRETGWVGPVLDTGEGRGAWLAIHPGSGRWYALLHRNDAPYNDCLPPGEARVNPEETLLEGSVRESVEAVVEGTEDAFTNPFDLVAGRPDAAELILLEQSFQGQLSRLEPGVHLRAHGEARNGAVRRLREEDGLGSPDELVALAETRPGDDDHALWIEDARRPTRAATVFDWRPGELLLKHASGFPRETGWRSIRRSPTG